MRAAIRLETMRKRVHAGTRRNKGGHADGECGIAQRDHGHQLGVKDDLFAVCGAVGQYTGAPNL